MVNIAHASTLAACKIKMKKFRAGRKKRQLQERLLTEEEREERREARALPDTISIQVEKMIYDFDHQQLRAELKPKLKELCILREAEIIKAKQEEIYRHQLVRIHDTLRRVGGI